ncbi:MAG: hypothetical protein IPI58_06240 [Alphaproteobacteria bacterium]|nr:MAG: hypothetical protein IPI58_06240 [Alphaproteobacteria bacterium]
MAGLIRNFVILREGEGFECGMAFENFDDVKEGDIIEAVEVEKVARQLA